MDPVTYEDRPKYDIWIKLIIILPIAIVLISALFTVNSDPDATTGMLITLVLLVVIFWLVFPRKYRLTGKGVKIVLGRPFSFTIKYRNIEKAEIPKGLTIGYNFVTSFKNTLQIVTRRGMNFNISPTNPALFIENLEKALDEWETWNQGGQ
jgi:hypothetical protein